MKPETTAYLRKAARNREAARALSDPTSVITVQPPLLDWAVVAAFYSAVHYVNAYVWERQSYEPPDHNARNRIVTTDLALRAAKDAYMRLSDLAWKARYLRRFQPARELVDEAINVDLTKVADTVEAALRQAAP
jgi:hypothetical protein